MIIWMTNVVHKINKFHLSLMVTVLFNVSPFTCNDHQNDNIQYNKDSYDGIFVFIWKIVRSNNDIDEYYRQGKHLKSNTKYQKQITDFELCES